MVQSVCDYSLQRYSRVNLWAGGLEKDAAASQGGQHTECLPEFLNELWGLY